MSTNAALFSGYDYFLILKDNRLFGIGSNSCAQLGNSREDYFYEPVFIADNVIAAAAGKEYSAYITADGEIKILGKGLFADLPVYVKNVKKIYISQKNQFLVTDSEGNSYGFGDNSDEKVCARTVNRVYEEKNIEKYYHYGSSVISKYSSNYHTMVTQVRTDDDKLSDMTSSCLKNFRETDFYKNLTGQNHLFNIRLLTTATDYSDDEMNRSCRCKITLTADILNNYIFEPVKLSAEEAEILYSLISKENGEFPEGLNAGGITKVALTRRNTGLAMNRQGNIITVDTENGKFAPPRIDFGKANDIAVTKGENYIDNYVVSLNNGDILMGSLSSIFPVSGRIENTLRDTLSNALFSHNMENILGGRLNNFEIKRLTLPEN